MSSRVYCDALLAVVNAMEEGIRSPLSGISQEHLNYTPAPHKMSIGQLAVHCMAASQWFSSDLPPFVKTELTYRPCEYPLTLEFVDRSIVAGMTAMRKKLMSIDDVQLEQPGPMEDKNLGYRLCRLQLHVLWHSAQMSYLRHLLDPAWFANGKGFFGRMATAYIAMPYQPVQPT